jgi:hypothetical protein
MPTRASVESLFFIIVIPLPWEKAPGEKALRGISACPEWAGCKSGTAILHCYRNPLTGMVVAMGCTGIA